MMGHRISYSDIPEGPARNLAALNDAREWLGTAERFNKIMVYLTHVESEDEAYMLLGFAGVQGLPAQAMWRFSQGME